jgi:hypothetical protein
VQAQLRASSHASVVSMRGSSSSSSSRVAVAVRVSAEANQSNPVDAPFQPTSKAIASSAAAFPFYKVEVRASEWHLWWTPRRLLPTRVDTLTSADAPPRTQAIIRTWRLPYITEVQPNPLRRRARLPHSHSHRSVPALAPSQALAKSGIRGMTSYPVRGIGFQSAPPPPRRAVAWVSLSG